MFNQDIRKMRMDLGKFLHNYYLRFGDKKYDAFLKRLGLAMESQYGEPFSSENLRIMEAEYITFGTVLNEKKKTKQNTQ